MAADPSPHDAAEAPPSRETIIAKIDELLAARAHDATICPSDAARALRPDGDWRALMDPVREAAASEVAAGRLEIRQKGEVVELETVRGPIRLGRPPA